MTSSHGSGEMAILAALALAQEFFATAVADGEQRVRLADAHVILSGRLDTWDGWPAADPAARRLTGRLLRARHNELASLRRFTEAARRACSAADSPFLIPAGVAPHDAAEVIALHGQPATDLARQMIERMEADRASRRGPVPAAGEGTWQFGWQDRSVVSLPDGLNPPAPDPPAITTTPHVAAFEVTVKELTGIAAELDQAWGGQPWREQVMNTILGGLRDDREAPVQELVLAASRLNLLNAPTGVGKTVLMRILAIAAARASTPIALVARDIDDAVAMRDAIAADAARLSWPARPTAPECAVLISSRRLHGKALQAADRGDWDRFDQLSYGCALASFVTSGPLPAAGDEPCTGLRPADPEDRSEPNPGKASRHACPWRSSCDRHRGSRAAATADIIVTYHHYLAGGHIQVPVRIDGIDVDRATAMEVIMRRCPVLVIDEIDQFQSSLVDMGSQELVLSVKGRRGQSLPLADIELGRDYLPTSADRQVLPPLSRARYLADQFLNYVLDGDLWLDEPDGRPASEWHLPGSNDGLLIKTLLSVPDGIEIPPFAYQTFNALFPDRDEPQAGELPGDLTVVRDLLSASVSNDDGADTLTELKHRLHDALAAIVPDAGIRPRIVNDLLVRAWLGSLRQALTRLTFAVTTPDTTLPAARVLAEKLGVFVEHKTIPYGPLGHMQFGFRIHVTPGTHGGQLSAQAIAGDPHTTTAQLGGLVALDACGTERIVLGMSATAFFPGAAREHIHAPITWAMTDADPGAVTAAQGSVLRDPYTAIRVAGQPEGAKDDILTELGHRLWDQHLGPQLAALRQDPGRADRARVLVVTNSYRQCALLAAGMSKATDPSRLAVAVSPEPAARQLLPPARSVQLTPDQFESFAQHAGTDVLLAPISRTARGLNILTPGQQRSAISQIWVCVRPVAQLSDAAELFASVNAHGLQHAAAAGDPAAILEAQRRAAHQRLSRLLGSDPRFSLMPRDLKAEIIAGILVDFIQLAGRARRGGTPVELYLVDNAFHDNRLRSDLPSLLRFHYESLTPAEQRAMARIYGSTLTSLLAYAGITPDKATS
jgi:hypothetical protein